MDWEFVLIINDGFVEVFEDNLLHDVTFGFVLVFFALVVCFMVRVQVVGFKWGDAWLYMRVPIPIPIATFHWKLAWVIITIFSVDKNSFEIKTEVSPLILDGSHVIMSGKEEFIVDKNKDQETNSDSKAYGLDGELF